MNPLVTGWYECSESKPYFNSLLKRNKRRAFGIILKKTTSYAVNNRFIVLQGF